MSSATLTPINATPTPTDATNPQINVTGAPPAAPATAPSQTAIDTSAASNPQGMVTMFSPDGRKGDIPKERVNDAVRSGFKIAIPMKTPDGQMGDVPLDSVHAAIGKGFAITNPVIDKLSDNTGVTGVGSGFAKGAVDTMRGAADIMGGEGTAERVGLPNVSTAPSGIAEKIGKGGEAVLEFMLGDASLKGLSMGEKLEKIAPIVKSLESHPSLAKLVGGAVRGAVIGGTQGAVKGEAEGDAFGGAERGAAMGAAGGAVAEIPAAIATRAAQPTVAAAEETPSWMQSIRNGADVAQPQAQQAIRSGVQAATENAGTADEALAANIKNQPLLGRNQTIVDEHLSALRNMERDAYDRMDEAAGFDVKAEKAQLSNDQYKLKQLGNTDADIALKDKLTASIQDSQSRIADAETKMRDAGIDPTEADALHKQRMAGSDFRKALIQNTSSDGQTVNLNGLLNASKKLQFSKYGNRLEQFFGSPEAANQFVSGLERAQKTGVTAASRQQIAKWLGTHALYSAGIGAVGTGVYELGKHLME